MGKDLPFESRKRCSRLRAPADVAPAVQQRRDKDRMRNEAGEPEEHGDGLNGQDRVGVRGAREVTRGEGKERDDEEGGPDAGKDEKVDAVGRRVEGIAVPP